MNTYTLVYTSIARNLSATAQAALMQSSAPLDLPTYVEAGLTFVSDVATTADPEAIRTIVFQDAAPPGGSMPPGVPMAQFLTDAFTAQIADGIQAPVTAAPVAVT